MRRTCRVVTTWWPMGWTASPAGASQGKRALFEILSRVQIIREEDRYHFKDHLRLMLTAKPMKQIHPYRAMTERLIPYLEVECISYETSDKNRYSEILLTTSGKIPYIGIYRLVNFMHAL